MSSNEPDPTGDSYEKYTGHQRPGAAGPPAGSGWADPGGGSPQDAPPASYGQPSAPPPAPPYPPQGPYGAPGNTAYPGQPHPGPQYPGPQYPGPAYPGPGNTAYPGQPYPGYGQPMYGGPRVPPKTAPTVVLLILSIMLTFVGCGLGIPSLVMSIIALSTGSSDGERANRVMKIGWVVFGIIAVLVVAFWTWVILTRPSSPPGGSLA